MPIIRNNFQGIVKENNIKPGNLDVVLIHDCDSKSVKVKFANFKNILSQNV